MPPSTKKSIRINGLTEYLLFQIKPELAHYGAGYIVEVLAAELQKPPLPIPLPPDQRRQMGAEKRGKQLKGKPALNKGKPKS